MHLLHSWCLTLLCCAADVAAAQLRLGVMYENGIGIRVNYKVGRRLFLCCNPALHHFCHFSDVL